MTRLPLNKCLAVVLVICVVSMLYSVRWIYATTYSLQLQGNMTIERGINKSSSDREYAIIELHYNYSVGLSNEIRLGRQVDITYKHSKTTESLSRQISNNISKIEPVELNETEQIISPHIGKEHNSATTERNVEQKNPKRIKIGILIPSSTRNIQKPVLQNLSLVTISIPSLYNTFEMKYIYKIYIGIDKGDRLEDFKEEIQTMFDRVVLVSAVGKNFVKSVNTIAERAYNDGMDYLVRINDDTKFVTASWTSLAIEKLSEYAPKNIGVVGLTCSYGNTAILTHDMVHRTHLDIFNFYYPPYFENWWADDWITRVYEPDRSSKLTSWTVKHLEGTVRYNVDFERESWVNSIIEYDKKRLKKYLENFFADKPM